MKEQVTEKKYHHGENVAALLGVFGMTQTQLADKINIQPSKLSRLLNKEVIDDSDLNNIAMAMSTELNADFIKTYDHELTKQFVISNNTFNAHSAENGNDTINMAGAQDITNNNYDNGVKEVFQLLLKEKDTRIEEKDQIISELKADLKDARTRN